MESRTRQCRLPHVFVIGRGVMGRGVTGRGVTGRGQSLSISSAMRIQRSKGGSQASTVGCVDVSGSITVGVRTASF